MNPADLEKAIASADKSTVQALVDSFFAGIEARYAGNPVAVALLKSANGAIDGVFAVWGL